MVGFVCIIFGVHLGWRSQRGTLFWVDQTKKTWCISKVEATHLIDPPMQAILEFGEANCMH